MDEPEYQEPSWVIAVEIICALLALCAAAIDGVVIYTVFYYKKLRTVPNMLVANWAIADIFVLVILHTNYWIVHLLKKADLSKVAIAVIEDCEWTFHITTLFFAALAAIDWYLASYFEEASRRFRRVYQWVIGAMWLVPILCMLIFGIVAMNGVYGKPYALFFFAYLGGFFCVLVFNVIKMVKKCRKRSSDHPTFMLTIVTVILTLWVPIWTSVFLSNKYTWWVVEICYLSTSVVTFVGMFRSNQDFQACVTQMVKCSSNKYTDDLAEFHENRGDDDAQAIIQIAGTPTVVL